MGIIRGVDDSFSRVSSALGSGFNATQLRSELAALNVALNATDATSADEALTRAKASLAAYRTTEMTVGDTPDADAVDIALLVVGNSMKRPCATATASPGASLSKCR